MCLQKVGPDGKPTESAHPARFSPDDKFSRERVTCKKRFGELLTNWAVSVHVLIKGLTMLRMMIKLLSLSDGATSA